MQGATVAVLLCAGQGTRMGLGHNKIFLPLAGEMLIVHTLRVFEEYDGIDEIILVAHPQEIEDLRAAVAPHTRKVHAIIAGGNSRHQSEYQAVTHMRHRIIAGEITTVLMHDGARPFIAPDELAAVITAATSYGAAILAAPVKDTELIAEVDAQRHITTLLPSDHLWRAQTPQAFSALLLLDAYHHAQSDGFEGTDTASSIERIGHTVVVVPGSDSNIKITTPDDIVVAERMIDPPHEHP